MMSSPVYPDFSGPVMSVPIVGNPITMRDDIDAPNNKVIAGPVAKKSVPISWRLTLEARKLHDVANNVIGTFLETHVSKCISSRIRPANPPPVLKPPSAFIAVAVQHVASRK